MSGPSTRNGGSDGGDCAHSAQHEFVQAGLAAEKKSPQRRFLTIRIETWVNNHAALTTQIELWERDHGIFPEHTSKARRRHVAQLFDGTLSTQ